MTVWPKRRLFGIDPKALNLALARHEQSVRERVAHLEQAAAQLRAEADRLQSEEAALRTLERELQAKLTMYESPFYLALEAHLLALQHLRAQSSQIRTVRARILDQIREALRPHLGEQEKEGHQWQRSGA